MNLRVINLRNIVAVVIKELIQLRRDPTTVALTLFLPIFGISVVNLGFGEIRDVTMVISDQDGNGQTKVIIDALRHVSSFKVVLEGNITDTDARQLVYNGVAKLVVIIPRGSSYAMEHGQKANLTVLVDATDMTIYQNIRGGLGEALKEIVNEKVKEYGATVAVQPVDFGMNYVYGRDLRVVDTMIPVVIAFMQSYISFSLTSMMVIKEKIARTLERVLVTPVRGSEILIGKLLASTVVTLGTMVLLLVLGFGIFGIKMAGSLFDVFVIAMMITLGGLGMGLAASAFAKKEVEAVMMMGAYITPALLMSGFMWPLEAMSPFVRQFAYLVPMTYANHALKAVMIGGMGIWSVMTDLAVLGAFAMATMMIGILMFRRELVAQI